MIVFCHIPKTAGMAINYILKSNFGCRHVASTTWGKQFPITTERDLDFELFPYAKVIALSGHGIRPFINYGKYNTRMKWFTLLRNPIDRVISHYIYDYEINRTSEDFRNWLYRNNGNFQVRWLAGKEDIHTAKEILTKKFVFVGLQEHFKGSLVLLKDLMFNGNLSISNEKRINATKSTNSKIRIVENIDTYSELIEEKNRLDIELFNFVKKEIWETQIARYGKDKLDDRIMKEYQDSGSSVSGRINRLFHEIYRNTVYKSTVFTAKILGIRS